MKNASKIPEKVKPIFNIANILAAPVNDVSVSNVSHNVNRAVAAQLNILSIIFVPCPLLFFVILMCRSRSCVFPQQPFLKFDVVQ